MKVYIERNNTINIPGTSKINMFPQTNIDFIHVYFSEARISMQYRSPNTPLDIQLLSDSVYCHLKMVARVRYCSRFTVVSMCRVDHLADHSISPSVHGPFLPDLPGPRDPLRQCPSNSTSNLVLPNLSRRRKMDNLIQELRLRECLIGRLERS